jgi:biotin carboxyl carrier protein
MFPNLAPGYARGPEPKAAPKPAPVTSAPEPAKVGTGEPARSNPGQDAVGADPPPAQSGQAAEFDVEVDGEVFKVKVSGAGFSVATASASASTTNKASPAPPKTGEGTVIAPMQGLIVKIPVKAGDEVKLGDVVAVLEAMKMQNDIVTTVAGRVSSVYVKEGEVVSPNQPLLAVG